MATYSLDVSLQADGQGERQFRSLLRRYIAFHTCCITLIVGQLIAFIHILTTSGSPSPLAWLVAGIVLSAFVYLVLHFYLQTQKPMRIEAICATCIDAHRHHSSGEEVHLAIAGAAYRFAASLEGEPFIALRAPFPFVSLKRACMKASFWLTWKECIAMRECALRESIHHHVELIKERPTDLEVHASLANTYVAIARLYLPPSSPELSWTKRLYESPLCKERFMAATHKALQEFAIIDTYAPDDPWVHAQLALCYHDLEMYDEEIAAYETILALCPDDKEVMYRLGILYFKEGKTAKGLRMYDALLRLGYSRVEHLLTHYIGKRL